MFPFSWNEGAEKETVREVRKQREGQVVVGHDRQAVGCRLHSFIQNGKEVELLPPHPYLVTLNSSHSLCSAPGPSCPTVTSSLHLPWEAGGYPRMACLVLHLFPPGFGTAQGTSWYKYLTDNKR